jgi:periplasmic divalent cation tolerance protein
MATTDFIVILSTCGSKTEAETIASRLVSDRAAACVNIIENITSIYKWQGKIEKGTECLMVIKTRAALAEQVEAIIQELSSYDCPEVVALPIALGSEGYLNWIIRVTEPCS